MVRVLGFLPPTKSGVKSQQSSLIFIYPYNNTLLGLWNLKGPKLWCPKQKAVRIVI